MRPPVSLDSSPDTGMAAPQLTDAGAVITAVGARSSTTRITACAGSDTLPASSVTMSCSVCGPIKEGSQGFGG